MRFTPKHFDILYIITQCRKLNELKENSRIILIHMTDCDVFLFPAKVWVWLRLVRGLGCGESDNSGRLLVVLLLLQRRYARTAILPPITTFHSQGVRLTPTSPPYTSHPFREQGTPSISFKQHQLKQNKDYHVHSWPRLYTRVPLFWHKHVINKESSLTKDSHIFPISSHMSSNSLKLFLYCEWEAFNVPI